MQVGSLLVWAWRRVQLQELRRRGRWREWSCFPYERQSITPPSRSSENGLLVPTEDRLYLVPRPIPVDRLDPTRLY